MVSTSEFNDVKARILGMHGRKAATSSDPKDAGKPTLRRNPNGTIDQNGQETAPAPDSQDRPTLKMDRDLDAFAARASKSSPKLQKQ